MRRSDDVANDAARLWQRIEEDGYVYLPGLLDRSEVLSARRDVLNRLAAQGAIDPTTDPMEGVPGGVMADLARNNGGVLPDLARNSGPLQEVLYAGRLRAFYERLFGEPVRHFDYTWLRAVQPGRGTRPHADAVFMNRGTPALMTAWVPLGDIDFAQGGLMILAGSHLLGDVRNDYCTRDVDTYCVNDSASSAPGEDSGRWAGYISKDPVELRRERGLRWLTGQFQAGDVVTFTMYTLHASLDNTSQRIRLSCDIRYQRASEPADPRWVGAEPPGRGPQSQRGVIC